MSPYFGNPDAGPPEVTVTDDATLPGAVHTEDDTGHERKPHITGVVLTMTMSPGWMVISS